MTSFGDDVNMEGFGKRTQIAGWIFYAVLATVGLLFILGASSFKEEYATRVAIGVLFLFPLLFRFKKAVRMAEKEGGFKILQRLTPIEGIIFIVMFLLGIGGIIMFCFGFEAAAWTVKISRFAFGTAATTFAVSYIYHMWRQINKKEGESGSNRFYSSSTRRQSR